MPRGRRTPLRCRKLDEFEARSSILANKPAFLSSAVVFGDNEAVTAAAPGQARNRRQLQQVMTPQLRRFGTSKKVGTVLRRTVALFIAGQSKVKSTADIQTCAPRPERSAAGQTSREMLCQANLKIRRES